MKTFFGLALFVTAVSLCLAQQKPPSVLSKIDPEYPEQFRTTNIEGTVTLRFNITKEGLPEEITVTTPLDPTLDQTAVVALGKWRFQPATKDGQAIAWSDTVVEMRFRLADLQEHTTTPKPAEASTPTPAPGVHARPLTKAEKKQSKAEHKRRDTEAQGAELMKVMRRCLELNDKPMGQITPAELSTLRSCRSSGLI